MATANPSFPRRIWLNYFTTAADTTEQTFEFATEDDYRDRYIETLYVGIDTAGVRLGFKTMATDYSYVDCSRFKAGDPVLDVDITVPGRQPFSITLTNRAGAALTDVPVMIGYRVDPSQGR